MTTNVTREQALTLLKKYNQEPFHLQHALTVEAVVSPQFYGWLFGLGAGAVLTGPDWAVEEFKALLAFCDNFPLEYDWESSQSGDYDEPTRIAEGRQMLVTEHISDFKSIQMQKAIFGGDITYIGFPVEDGGVGSSFSVNSGLAMSASCADKEGAWTYMRQLLLPHYAAHETASHWGGHTASPPNKPDSPPIAPHPAR